MPLLRVSERIGPLAACGDEQTNYCQLLCVNTLSHSLLFKNTHDIVKCYLCIDAEYFFHQFGLVF